MAGQHQRNGVAPCARRLQEGSGKGFRGGADYHLEFPAGLNQGPSKSSFTWVFGDQRSVLHESEGSECGPSRFTSVNQAAAILWPVNEAAVAGFTCSEISAGPRATPQPADPDINSILASVTGSLFADVDAKATFWQRARQLPPARFLSPPSHAAETGADILPMLDAFRLAYTNLREIWSLVLPPNTLLGLKRLYLTEPAAFRMPDGLWARIVYDFLLAYRLRTMNRGHLLGALIPLYLAWVASHINITASGTEPEQHIEAVAAAFELDKPYLVSRWRWPDRFNP